MTGSSATARAVAASWLTSWVVALVGCAAIPLPEVDAAEAPLGTLHPDVAAIASEASAPDSLEVVVSDATELGPIDSATIEGITSAELPPAVVAAVEVAAPGAAIERAGRRLEPEDQEIWRVSVRVGGQLCTLLVDPSGVVAERACDISAGELPAPVGQALATLMGPAFSVERLQLVEGALDRHFTVRGRAQGRVQRLDLSPSGEVLARYVVLPAEVNLPWMGPPLHAPPPEPTPPIEAPAEPPPETAAGAQ